jgi:hypothetical protein
MVGITLTDMWCLSVSRAMRVNASIVVLLQTLLDTCLLGDVSHFLSLGFDGLCTHVLRLNSESLHISDWQVDTNKHFFSRYFMCLQHELLLDKRTVITTRCYWRCCWGWRERQLLHSTFHRYLSLLSPPTHPITARYLSLLFFFIFYFLTVRYFRVCLFSFPRFVLPC